MRTFEAPSALREIGERAFFACASLESISLNEKLQVIKADAFSNSGISSLRIPNSIVEIGYPVAARTSLVYAGEDATFTLDPGSERLILDESGALYELQGDGMKLLCLFDSEAKRFEAAEGTTEVAPGALLNHAALEEVVLPEGVRIIGAAACKGCRALRRIAIPGGVVEMGAEALMDTALESLHIPASLEKIGENALVTYNAHNGSASRRFARSRWRRAMLATKKRTACCSRNGATAKPASW